MLFLLHKTIKKNPQCLCCLSFILLCESVITFSFNLISHQSYISLHPQRLSTVSTTYFILNLYKYYSSASQNHHPFICSVPSNPGGCQQGQQAGSIDIPLIITHNDNNMKLPRGHAWNILVLTSSFHFMAVSDSVRL